MTNGIFGGAVLTAHLMCDSHVVSATKVAPPFLPFLLLWDSSPSLAEGVGGWVIASEQCERGNQPCAKLDMGILCRLIASAMPRNDKK